MADKDKPQAPPAVEGAPWSTGSTESSTPSKPQIFVVPNSPQALQQPAPHVPLLIGPISNPNFLENQMKMQKLIYLGQMIGWTHVDFRTMSRYKGLCTSHKTGHHTFRLSRTKNIRIL